MAIINKQGKPERNLQEQVIYLTIKAEQLEKALEEAKTLLGFDIRVIDVIPTWEEPTGTFDYGDTILVGPEGGPFTFYIYTRGINGPYWLDFGRIAIEGPQGPQGERGPQGEPGTSTRWYIGSGAPTGPDIQEGDCWLRNSDSTVYIYEGGRWMARANIRGLQGIQGPEGKQGPRGLQGEQGPQGPRGNPAPIVDILDILTSEEQLPDPNSVDPNSGFLITEAGTTYLFIIVNGIWVNSGRWGGGTSVYENDAFVESFDADTKLNKITSAGNVRFYSIQANGTNGVHQVATSPAGVQASYVPLYWGKSSGSQPAETEPTGKGVLITSTPTKPFHCATKKYVDDKIAEKHGDELIKPIFMVAAEDVSYAPTMNIPLGLNASTMGGGPTMITLKLVDGWGFMTMNNSYSPLYGIGQDPGTLTIHNTGQPLEPGTYCGWHMLTVNGSNDLLYGTAYIDTLTDTTIGIKFGLEPNFQFGEMYLSYIAPHDSTWYFS